MVDLKTMKVVMLPSEKVTSFAYSEEDHNHVMLPCPETGLCDMQQLHTSTYGCQHLYLVSNENINRGDQVYDRINKTIFKTSICSTPSEDPQYFKVVATTDKHLSLDTSKDGLRFDAVLLISEDFVKAFVKSNGAIDKVQIEYEKGVKMSAMMEEPFRRPKIREDGTVFIHRVKDKLTSVQETVIMLEKLMGNWDNLSADEMKVMLNSYLEILKEDSGINDLRDNIETQTPTE